MSTSQSRRKKRGGRAGRPSPELPPADLLRHAREGAGLTQAELARQLRCTQQAIAQAERPSANHTVDFLRRWARACKRRLSIRLD